MWHTKRAVPTPTAMHSYRELHVGGERGHSNHYKTLFRFSGMSSIISLRHAIHLDCKHSMHICKLEFYKSNTVRADYVSFL